jgi:hypothetical protein
MRVGSARVWAFLDYEWADDGGSNVGPEYSAQFGEFCSASESIAADPALPAAERDIARETLDDISDQARQLAGEALTETRVDG